MSPVSRLYNSIHASLTCLVKTSPKITNESFHERLTRGTIHVQLDTPNTECFSPRSSKISVKSSKLGPTHIQGGIQHLNHVTRLYKESACFARKSSESASMSMGKPNRVLLSEHLLNTLDADGQKSNWAPL